MKMALLAPKNLPEISWLDFSAIKPLYDSPKKIGMHLKEYLQLFQTQNYNGTTFDQSGFSWSMQGHECLFSGSKNSIELQVITEIKNFGQN